MSGFSSFVLNFSKSSNILLILMPKKRKLSAHLSTIVIGRRDKALVHKFRVMATVELHVNVTYYAQQHSTLQSFYGKGQSVIGGASYSPSTGQYLAQGLLEIPKQVT